MPTGLTAGIAHDMSFEDFIWDCARQFGALISMRDYPKDAPIPDAFNVSNYHTKALKQEKEMLEELKNMSRDALTDAAEAEFECSLASYEKSIVEHAELRDKYLAMQAKVESWEPPSPDHFELKTFMLNQIKESIDYDCSDKYNICPARQTGFQHFNQYLKRLLDSISDHTKEHRKEVKRAAGRTKWVQQLKQSLA